MLPDSLNLLNIIINASQTDEATFTYVMNIIPVKSGLASRQDIFNAPRTEFKQKTDLHWQNVKALSVPYAATVTTARQSGTRRRNVLEAQFERLWPKQAANTLGAARNTIVGAYQFAQVDCPNAGRNVFVEQEYANALATAQNIYDDIIAASKAPGFKPTTGWLATANKNLSAAKRAAKAVYDAAKPTPAQLLTAKTNCLAAAKATYDTALAAFNSPANIKLHEDQAKLGLFWSSMRELTALRALPLDPAYIPTIEKLQYGLYKYADYIKTIYELCGLQVPPNWNAIKNPA